MMSGFHATILIHIRVWHILSFPGYCDNYRKDTIIKIISEPSTSDAGDGLPLIESIKFDVKKCILCQQLSKDHKVISGLYDQKNIKRAASVRQDEKVCKRLKIVAESQSKSFAYYFSKMSVEICHRNFENIHQNQNQFF